MLYLNPKESDIRLACRDRTHAHTGGSTDRIKIGEMHSVSGTGYFDISSIQNDQALERLILMVMVLLL